MANIYFSRLQSLQKAMYQYALAAYIIPTADPHQSEYLAEHWKSREWLCGFTGSAGTAVVTTQFAGLWTDSRYFLQAEQELKDTGFHLEKMQVQGTTEYVVWLKNNLPSGSQVGLDGNLFSLTQVKNMKREFSEKNIELITSLDLMASIWENRPSLPLNPIFEYEVKYAGRMRKEKLAAIRQQMKTSGVDFHLITTLDDIGWTLNLRGSDIECNPVAVSYAIIGHDAVYLFIENKKVPENIKQILENEGIIIKPYQSIASFLNILPEHQSILIDPNSINFTLFNAITQAKKVMGDTISMPLKAIKNEVEIQHIRRTMIKDGVALLRVFRWLEHTLKTRAVAETEVAEQIIAERSKQEYYVGESFAAIVGYESNGAIVHYRPMPDTAAKIYPKGILLVDSGGQYLDGTTDITRTIALGKPTQEQKKAFTLVLKGHISLAMQSFPEGTKGIQLDVLARQHLWQHRLNFGHGTGHGVGFFMNVHEPPQGFISGLGQRGTTVIEAGMLTSNEPGFYQNGAYGIRIENLVLAQLDEKTAFGQFLRFETVTLFPIDRQLIEVKRLNKQEKTWLNDYHQRVFEQLSPYLEEDERIWLEARCERIK